MEWMKQASTSAEKSDAVFFFVFGLSLLFLIFITILMIYFVIRYSKKRHPKAEQIEVITKLAEGKLDAQGVFQASNLLVKCPSKYEESKK